MSIPGWCRSSPAPPRAAQHPPEPPSPPTGTGQPRPVLALAVTAGSPPALGLGTLPVSSLFWVRSAGQELLVTPTREAVTWGSPL